jgi:hypothetical protein
VIHNLYSSLDELQAPLEERFVESRQITNEHGCDRDLQITGFKSGCDFSLIISENFGRNLIWFVSAKYCPNSQKVNFFAYFPRKGK